ncbi:TPA: hypothetical protein ACF7ZB_001927 [Kluyvera georgiana]
MITPDKNASTKLSRSKLSSRFDADKRGQKFFSDKINEIDVGDNFPSDIGCEN